MSKYISFCVLRASVLQWKKIRSWIAKRAFWYQVMER